MVILIEIIGTIGIILLMVNMTFGGAVSGYLVGRRCERGWIARLLWSAALVLVGSVQSMGLFAFDRWMMTARGNLSGMTTSEISFHIVDIRGISMLTVVWWMLTIPFGLLLGHSHSQKHARLRS